MELGSRRLATVASGWNLLRLTRSGPLQPRSVLGRPRRASEVADSSSPSSCRRPAVSCRAADVVRVPAPVSPERQARAGAWIRDRTFTVGSTLDPATSGPGRASHTRLPEAGCKCNRCQGQNLWSKKKKKGWQGRRNSPSHQSTLQARSKFQSGRWAFTTIGLETFYNKVCVSD